MKRCEKQVTTAVFLKTSDSQSHHTSCNFRYGCKVIRESESRLSSTKDLVPLPDTSGGTVSEHVESL